MRGGRGCGAGHRQDHCRAVSAGARPDYWGLRPLRSGYPHCECLLLPQLTGPRDAHHHPALRPLPLPPIYFVFLHVQDLTYQVLSRFRISNWSNWFLSAVRRICRESRWNCVLILQPITKGVPRYDASHFGGISFFTSKAELFNGRLAIIGDTAPSTIMLVRGISSVNVSSSVHPCGSALSFIRMLVFNVVDTTWRTTSRIRGM